LIEFAGRIVFQSDNDSISPALPRIIDSLGLNSGSLVFVNLQTPTMLLNVNNPQISLKGKSLFVRPSHFFSSSQSFVEWRNLIVFVNSITERVARLEPE
jgi:hypothetical protein